MVNLSIDIATSPSGWLSYFDIPFANAEWNLKKLGRKQEVNVFYSVFSPGRIVKKGYRLSIQLTEIFFSSLQLRTDFEKIYSTAIEMHHLHVYVLTIVKNSISDSYVICGYIVLNPKILYLTF